MKCNAIGIAALSVSVLPSWMPVQGGFAQSDPPHNILVVVLDDVGKETLDCYYPLVPNAPVPATRTDRISQLAGSGVKFTRVYSSPLCSPTRATILTGRYAFRTGMGYLASALNEGLEDYSLPLEEITIPEALTPSGPIQPPQAYSSGAFGKWHLSATGDLMHPIDQGFDYFVGSVENTGGHFNWDKIVADSTGATSTHIGQAYSPDSGTYDESTFSASVIRQAASAWISSVQEPYFAYVCFNPPHHPWQVPPYSLLPHSAPPIIDESLYPQGEPQSDPPGTDPVNARLAYGWMLEAIDTEIGKLVDNIPAGKRSRTTIIVVADNGTPGHVIHPFYDSAHAKGRVYDQGVNVPMIANGYKVNAGGQTCTGLVVTADIWRTVIALAGLPAPTGFPFDGKSFKHMLMNPLAASNRTRALSQLFIPNGSYNPNNPDYHVPFPCPGGQPALAAIKPSHQRAMTDGRFKYIRRYDLPAGAVGYQEAYDLLNDPLETNDLWSAWGWSQCASETDPPLIPDIPFEGQVEVWDLRNAMVALSAP